MIADSRRGISRKRLVARLLLGARRGSSCLLGENGLQARMGCLSSSMRVQAAVPEVVWCPANIIEMNIPVTSSADEARGFRPRSSRS